MQLMQYLMFGAVVRNHIFVNVSYNVVLGVMECV